MGIFDDVMNKIGDAADGVLSAAADFKGDQIGNGPIPINLVYRSEEIAAVLNWHTVPRVGEIIFLPEQNYRVKNVGHDLRVGMVQVLVEKV